MNDTWAPNKEEYETIEKIANSTGDGPILMININKYHASAGFPNGKPYTDWMKVLPKMVEEVGGKLLWQVPSLGQPVGQQAADEILGAWYPSHKAFLSLKEQPSAAESFRLRELCVSEAVVHRCPENIIPKKYFQKSYIYFVKKIDIDYAFDNAQKYTIPSGFDKFLNMFNGIKIES